jgi:hypothetical protein
MLRCEHGKLFLGLDTTNPLQLNTFGQVFVAGAGKASGEYTLHTLAPRLKRTSFFVTGVFLSQRYVLSTAFE